MTRPRLPLECPRDPRVKMPIELPVIPNFNDNHRVSATEEHSSRLNRDCNKRSRRNSSTRRMAAPIDMILAAQSGVSSRMSPLAALWLVAVVLASQSRSLAASSSPFEFVALGQEQQVAAASSMLLQEPQSLAHAAGPFDPATHRSVYEAIRAHPELREFAQLCELDGVKEIVRMDRTPLTVFAPIDRSLVDLLAKSKSRSLSLVDLAKQHIAQGLVTPDENTKYPLQFSAYSLLSPLYLSQQPAARGSQPQVFLNNAKILASYLIAIDADNYQALHLIDQPLEFAYLNRRAQLRGGAAASAPSGQRKTTVKRAGFSLDELLAASAEDQHQSPVVDFYERFGDLSSGQPQVDLVHARALRGNQRVSVGRDQLKLEPIARLARQLPELRGKLFNVNETNSLNTYFLPLNSEELEALLESGGSLGALALAAHVVPDAVLFTRPMGLGQPHATLLERSAAAAGQRVTLSLAKTLELEAEPEDERRLLASPLLLQAKCAGPDAGPFRAGVTSAELLVANIPLTNGVLHLIRRPLLLAANSLLDLINDHDNQLSDVVNALGTQTAAQSQRSAGVARAGISRFRELLARERQVLAAMSMEPALNRTILAPSDEAFARLRYDLRALVQGDEALVPKHWDASYRHDLLERLVKRHLVVGQSLTSADMSSGQRQALADNGKQLSFSATPDDEQLSVESDGTEARVVHKDLIGTNGVLHVIDRVLGEEQETVYTLLKSLVLKFNHSLEESNYSGNELQAIVQANLRNQHQELISSSTSQSAGAQPPESADSAASSPELQAISRSIGQYLDELASSNRRQLQLLASSVNVSFQLARLSSLADGLDDWNDKFKAAERQFTYFVPSDLAWIKLQQAQPELYRPLMHFLESPAQAAHSASGDADRNQEYGAQAALRPSESSQRLRQILERHLLVTGKLQRRELERLDALQTLGATLRLVDAAPGSQQLTAFGDGSSSAPSSAFAALHSIVTGSSGHSAQPHQQAPRFAKMLKLNEQSAANLVQAHEASNGIVYVIDAVLLQPNDSEFLVQTSSSPAISSTVSSLLGHNSAITDFLHNLFASPASAINLSAQSVLALIGTLTLAIALLLALALILVVRRRRQTKLNRHQQLESGLTSSSSANSTGSTSTTKSL